MLAGVVICSCAIGILYVILHYRTRRKIFLNKIENIPDLVKNYPIVGSVLPYIGKSPVEIFSVIIDEFLNGPSICKIFVFTKLFIVVQNPDDIQKILTSSQCYNKGDLYAQANLGNGLVTADSNTWYLHRKLLNPSFHRSLIKQYVDVFNDYAKRLVCDLQSHVDHDLFDVEPFVSYRITDLSLNTLYNVEMEPKVTQIIAENIHKIFKSIGERILIRYVVLIISFFSKLLGFNQTDFFLKNEILKYMSPLVDKFKQSDDNIDKNKFHTVPGTFIEKLVVLQQLGYFTQEQMFEQIITMLLASTDTLSTAISNCILSLAMNPDIQERCVQEIFEVLGHKLNTITYDDMSKLELLTRSIHESLRLIPPVGFIARKCDNDFRLNNDIVVPADTNIIFPIITIHRKKEYWGDNPTRFNPDNFLPENVTKRPLLSYMPFSYGNRGCIGKKYADYALIIFMAHLLANFKFSTYLKLNELKFTYAITNKVLSKHMIQIEQR